MKICVFPGSFDPFTLGHLDVVRRAAKIFDKVYVAVMVNSAKQGHFTPAERKQIADISCVGINGVEVITADGMLVDLCRALGACAIVKGIRNGTDLDYEMMQAGVNKYFDEGLETVFLPTSAKYSFICSAFVRELIKYGRPFDDILHPAAVDLITCNFKDKLVH